MIAVLDLTKAYDRVVREILVTKLESMGVPPNLVSKIIVFLVPLLVQTAGDVTHTVAVLTTGLTQGAGGLASPALFRIFIYDLAGELRTAQGKPAEEEGDSWEYPAKLVADDVIIIARNSVELQKLLDTCTDWAKQNCLEWIPTKCAVVTRVTGNDSSDGIQQFKLSGQVIPKRDEARYLGVTIMNKGFVKRADIEHEKQCMAACVAATRQPFFDASLPSATIRTLFRTNIRSTSMYGLMLIKKYRRNGALRPEITELIY